MENEEALLVVEGNPAPPPQKTSAQVLTKFVVSALLMAVSFCFLFSPIFFAASSTGRAQEDPSLMEKTGTPHTRLPEMALGVEKEGSWIGQCDLFNGKWIPNPSGSAYTNETCNFIEAPQNCMKNGRPDNLYLYWRWKPYGCDIPPFNAEKFMNSMRNRSWGLIGDSIFRNHAQSLICLLSKVEEAVEVYHDEKYKSRTWYFPSHNFTLAIIWAPLLLKADISEDNEGRSNAPIQLHLDILESKWTSEYYKYDYIVISGGQWFLKTMIFWENDTVVGCHNCEHLRELGVEYPYRKALELALRFLVTSDHKPLIVFRTWTPSHFEYGEWFNGGVCNRTLPYKEGQYDGTPTDNAMRRVEIEEFEKAAVTGSKKGVRMKIMDIFHLSLLRPDGHPGPYRTFHPFSKNRDMKVQNDCLHWCLPGPIDAWNDILLDMLLHERDVWWKDFLVPALLAGLLLIFLLSLLFFCRVQIKKAVNSSLGWMIRIRTHFIP